MLIYNNLYLHNIYEIEKEQNYTRFYRFPKQIKSFLESTGDVSSILHGSEIRFIIEGEVEIDLISIGSNSSVVIYYGDYQDKSYTINSMSPTKLILKLPFEPKWMNTIYGTRHRYNPNLVRIVLYEEIALSNIRGNYSLPTSGDMPKLKALSYGTSISQGRRSYYPDISFPQIFAENIKYDIDNLAMSGSCFIEKEYVDFLVSRDYDLFLLELSTNMLGKGYDPSVFRKRVNYLFSQIKLTNPKAVVMAISILTSYRDLSLIKTDLLNTENRHVYRKILEDLCIEYGFHYIEGSEILKHYHLTYDLLHPGHYGMIEISNHLTNYFNTSIKKTFLK